MDIEVEKEEGIKKIAKEVLYAIKKGEILSKEDVHRYKKFI